VCNCTTRISIIGGSSSIVLNRKFYYNFKPLLTINDEKCLEMCCGLSGDFNVPFGTQEKEACAMKDLLKSYVLEKLFFEEKRYNKLFK